MSLANVAYSPVLTWANPLLRTLEAQALVPLFGEDPVELGMTGKEDLLLARLRATQGTGSCSPRLFRRTRIRSHSRM